MVRFYCEDVTSSFSTTCIRVPNLNPGRYTSCRCKWPRCLRRGFAAAHSMGMWVRISLGTWMFVSCECCVLSGRDLCVGLITRPEECPMSVIAKPSKGGHYPESGRIATGKKVGTPAVLIETAGGLLSLHETVP